MDKNCFGAKFEFFGIKIGILVLRGEIVGNVFAC